MPCANASGTHKLPLVFIGTAQKPHAFKSVNLSVYYLDNEIKNKILVI